ncbi:MAG: GNAT family N-acetyltransferase [Hymenobacter sp.]
MWGATPSPRPPSSSAAPSATVEQPWNRCIIATDQGVPCCGLCLRCRAASDRLWCYLGLAEDHRRRGVGSTLLTMLQHEAAASPTGITALRSKVTPGTTGAAFAEPSPGALQRSRLVVVEARGPRGATFDDPAGPQLEEAATGSVELTRALATFYPGPCTPGIAPT